MNVKHKCALVVLRVVCALCGRWWHACLRLCLHACWECCSSDAVTCLLPVCVLRITVTQVPYFVPFESPVAMDDAIYSTLVQVGAAATVEGRRRRGGGNHHWASCVLA
jgi:hypothetical protein